MGIIFVIVFGTLMATTVLFIHSQKSYDKSLSPFLIKICTNHFVWSLILEPPSTLINLWTEYGIINNMRINTNQINLSIFNNIKVICNFG